MLYWINWIYCNYPTKDDDSERMKPTVLFKNLIKILSGKRKISNVSDNTKEDTVLTRGFHKFPKTIVKLYKNFEFECE